MYFIDDSNSTIQYSAAGSQPWNHKAAGIANNSADVTKCYDQTYTVNQNLCSQSDSCHFQLSFTGSGITLFVIQSYNPLNTTMTLDGKTSTNANIINLPGYSDLAYNVTLYKVQSLPVADHTLDVALESYTFSNGTSMGSLIRFDSAAVNETSPSSVSPSSSGAGTSSPTSVSPAASHSVIGPAVGGAVGGIALIVGLIFALLLCRRRKSSPHVAEVDPDPSPMVIEATPPTFDAASTLYSSHSPSQPFGYASASRSSFPASDSNDWRSGSFQPSQSSGRTPSSSAPLISHGNAPYPTIHPFTVANVDAGARSNAPHTAHMRPSKRAEAQSAGTSSAPISTTSLPLTLPGGGELTEEQILFVNNLRNHNVPAAEVARLMEVMRRERESGLSADVRQGDPTVGADAPPPRYDFKTHT